MARKQKKLNKLAILIILLVIVAAIFIVVKIINSNKVNLVTINKEDVVYYVLRKEGKVGVLDKDGNVVIEPKYADIMIPNPTKDTFIVTDAFEAETKWYAVNKSGEKILTQYSDLQAIPINSFVSYVPYEKTTLIYKENGKLGLAGIDGNKITDAIYEEITGIDYKEGYLKAKKDNYYGVININGKTVINFEYDSITADGYYDKDSKNENAGFILRVRSDNGYRFGYADANGNVVLKTTYNEVNRLTEIEGKDVYLQVTQNGKVGIMKNNNELLKIEFQDVEYDKGTKLFLVEQNKAYGIYNLNGDCKVPIDYNSISFAGDILVCYKGDVRKVFDTEGNEFESKYESYKKVNDEYGIVIDSEGKYNICNKSMKTTSSTGYVYIEYFTNNLFIATNDGKTGVVDATGNIKVPFEYGTIQKVNDTNVLQGITIDESRMDIIESNGNINKALANANLVKTDKYIKVYNDTDVKYYSLDGKESAYKDLVTGNAAYASKQNGKWGAVDSTGKTIIGYDYEMVTELTNGKYIGVKKNGKWGVVDSTGKEILSPKYELNSLNNAFLGEYYEIENGTSVPSFCGDSKQEY